MAWILEKSLIEDWW